MKTESYRQTHPHDVRAKESSKMIEKYPDRIPVIVEPGKDMPEIDKKKYLVPNDLTIGQFAFVIRKRIKLVASEALFLLSNNVMLPVSGLMSMMYAQNKSDDGFLYITYNKESVYGECA